MSRTFPGASDFFFMWYALGVSLSPRVLGLNSSPLPHLYFLAGPLELVEKHAEHGPERRDEAQTTIEQTVPEAQLVDIS